MDEKTVNSLVFVLTIAFTALGMEHVQVLLSLFDISALYC